MYRIIKVDTVYGVEAESREGSYDNHRGFLRGFIKGDVGLYSLGKRVILRMDFCISYPSYAFVDFCEVWVKVKVSARVGVGESKQKWIVKDIGDGSYTVAYAMCALMLVPAYCLRRSSKPRSHGLTSRDFKLSSRAGEFLLGRQQDHPHETIHPLDVVLRESASKGEIIGRFLFSPKMGIGPLGDGTEFADQEAVLETVAKITHEKTNKNDT
ncbi:hypothetical protein Tco_1261180 [Tanacetum coccineum]